MIFRLACLQIQSHRLRTIFAAVAAVLTSILDMTVISISYCILDSTQLSRMLAAGSDFHASVTGTCYSVSIETLCREIQNAPEVSEAFLLGIHSAISADTVYTGSGHQGMDIAFTDSEKSLPHLFMTPTKGQFPQSRDEIMLYEKAFPAASVGNHVRFTYDCSNGETMEIAYTVSGFYDCEADTPLSAVTLYDENSLPKIGMADQVDMAAQVMIRFHSSFGIDRRLEAVTERLEEWELPGVGVGSQINYAYAAADFGVFFRPGNVLLILFVVAVVFFAAFLLIYNIFSISLAQDMRTLGLLQVIGTTYRQMKRLTYVQIILIGCAALPAGLLLGYFIGFRLLSPVFMSLSGKILPYRFSLQQKDEFALKAYQDILDSGLINSVVLGIPDALCPYLVVSEEDKKSIFYKGEELYDSRHVLHISTDDYGQSFDSTYFFIGDALSSDALEMDYEVIGAKLPYGIHTALGEICSCQYLGSEEALFLLPMSVFEKEFPDAPVFAVLANAKVGMGETLREEVQAYSNGRGLDFNGTSYLYRASGKLNMLANLRARLAALRLTGYSLCGIIFLIGLLNMVNSALTSMVLRRREFAMLETVGMTRCQLRKMLLYENSVGGVFGLASFVVGSVLSHAILTQTFGVDIALISLPAIGILLFLFAAGGVTAELSYRMLTKTSLTQRIRLGG